MEIIWRDIQQLGAHSITLSMVGILDVHVFKYLLYPIVLRLLLLGTQTLHFAYHLVVG